MFAVSASTSSLRGGTAFSASGPSLKSRSLFLMTFSLRLVSSSRCYRDRQRGQDSFTFMFLQLTDESCSDEMTEQLIKDLSEVGI